MKDKIILVTGGTGGIGKQTALELAKMGAQVIITGRSRASGEAAAAELRQSSGNERVDVMLADLSTQAGVHSLSDQFQQKYKRLDVLINNAGALSAERTLTEDGIESTFAVNVVTPFLLTNMLMERLKASPSGRVITVTGGSHPAKIELDNLQGERSYLGANAYSHSKVVMMAVMYEFAQRTQDSNVTINVCFPGGASTAMSQSMSGKMMPFPFRYLWPVFKMIMTRPDDGRSAAKAARSSIYLASSAEVEGISGTYFDTNSKAVPWPAPVLDTATRQKIWAVVEPYAQVSVM